MTSDGNTAADAQLATRRKAAKMLIAVVTMFALCYLPVYVLNILKYAGILDGRLSSGSISLLALVSHLVCYFNSAVNPIIYNFMSAKFRKEFHSACSCCFVLLRGRRVREESKKHTIYSYKYSSHIGASQTEQLTVSAMDTEG